MRFPTARPAPGAALALLLLLTTLPACAEGQTPPPAPARLTELSATITERSMRAHIDFLASDALLGRDTPSPGLETAAEYLAEHHLANGLLPGGEGGSYLQRFPYGDAMVPNVLAMLPGRDPALRDEYIVVSAHFDHVGIGFPSPDGDSIYNGADDNASGTTALLEAARVLAALPPELRPRRSILFAHVSAEEKGLLGSRWWVENPTVPIGSVIANVNVDMISGTAIGDTLAVLGAEFSTLGPLMWEVNAESPDFGITTSLDLWPQEQLFFRSDQLNFMRFEIPALFLFTGLHECYHSTCDEPDFVDAEKAARVARLLTHTLYRIAELDGRPMWTPDGLTEVRRRISGGG